MVVEQEIKLRVLTDKPLELASVNCVKQYLREEGQSNHLISHYFDSEDLDLFKLGYGLRRRFNGRHWLQTLKDNGLVKDGLHQRQEWEHQLEGDAFDIDLLKQTPLKDVINDPKIWPKIRTLFSTDFIRQSWQLFPVEGCQIELAYDRGRVYLGQDESSIHELELELKAGELSQLHKLAARLKDELPLQTSDISKAQRGYELVKRRLTGI